MRACLIADVTGSLLVASLCLFAYLIVPGSAVPPMAWPCLYAMALGCCLFAWHYSNEPAGPVRWLSYAALSLLAAVVWHVVALIAGPVLFPQPAPAAAKIFDLGVTLAFAPGLTVFAILGSVRALVLARC
jgi:hypothetical protein